jgi:hypothetical protein
MAGQFAVPGWSFHARKKPFVQTLKGILKDSSGLQLGTWGRNALCSFPELRVFRIGNVFGASLWPSQLAIAPPQRDHIAFAFVVVTEVSNTC